MREPIDWAALQAPFDPADVDFLPLTGNQVAAYVDARVVMQRLNTVVGPDGWSFAWEPMVISAAAARSERSQPLPHDVVWVAKGTLTIHGVSKSYIGDADATETSKAA